jgi:hypothetical protein
MSAATYPSENLFMSEKCQDEAAAYQVTLKMLSANDSIVGDLIFRALSSLCD